METDQNEGLRNVANSKELLENGEHKVAVLR